MFAIRLEIHVRTTHSPNKYPQRLKGVSIEACISILYEITRAKVVLSIESCLHTGGKYRKKNIGFIQFGPGLCFYPEFRVPVRSSEKGPGRTLVRSSGSEKGSGLTLVRQVWTVRRKERAETWFCRLGVRRKDRAEPWFGRFGVRRKEWTEPWFGRFGVRRKNLAEP